MRVIRLWTSDLIDIGDVVERLLAVVPTGIAFSASTEVRLAGSRRTTRSTGSASSSRTRPMVCGVNALRTSLPIWAAVEPTRIARFGSTRTWISGAALARSLTTLARPASCSRPRGRVGGLGDDGRVLALTTTVSLFALAPPCWPTVTS